MKKLPTFNLSLIDGTILKSHSVKKTILFFYPKAMTPGCTIEVQEFQKFLSKFKKMEFTIIGCSKDSLEKNFKGCDYLEIYTPSCPFDINGNAKVIQTFIVQ